MCVVCVWHNVDGGGAKLGFLLFPRSEGLDRSGFSTNVAFVDKADKETSVNHPGDVQDVLIQRRRDLLPKQHPEVHVKQKVPVVYQEERTTQTPRQRGSARTNRPTLARAGRGRPGAVMSHGVARLAAGGEAEGEVEGGMKRGKERGSGKWKGG